MPLCSVSCLLCLDNSNAHSFMLSPAISVHTFITCIAQASGILTPHARFPRICLPPPTFLALQDNNSSNFVIFPAKLLPADRYFIMKSQILEEMGFSAMQDFPVFADRMPNQLFAYLRLSRIQDPALFAKVCAW